MPVSRRELLAAASLLCLPAQRLFADEPAPSPNGQEINDHTQAAVQKGVEWMRKTMHRGGGCGVDLGQPPDIGCTAMVGLSLLSQGNSPLEGPRSQEVQEIISFMLKTVESMPSEDITTAQHTQLQNKIGRHAHTFFATLFLSQVVGQGLDPDQIYQALQRLVAVIVRTQDSHGSWGSDAWAPVLGTVMGWVALRSAHLAGLKVGASPERTAEHLIKQMRDQLGNDSGWMHTLYKNATGIRVLYEMGVDQDEISRNAFKSVLALVERDNTAFTQAGGEEYLAFHLITETMLQKGGDDWARWYPVIREKILSVQNRDGSWTGHHCITSRTFCTAAACLVLTSPNRYLPISQP
ncbi:prenyltransferase/squalene oxidase repeat-containing protein [Lignipirellula cremea]|uniref:Prenyltransferase and squalene oxidase repeat protein n=1 Tax=Lignipirellula cremea TaxID=2528010 RepID=A0A518DSW5_9BACT|nr:hypothetical protein [Lignipirellula cremea]QDU94936.1 hypothetical protein Pla8534_27440 [Lignipirellula cremea]